MYILHCNGYMLGTYTSYVVYFVHVHVHVQAIHTSTSTCTSLCVYVYRTGQIHMYMYVIVQHDYNRVCKYYITYIIVENETVAVISTDYIS